MLTLFDTVKSNIGRQIKGHNACIFSLNKSNQIRASYVCLWGDVYLFFCDKAHVLRSIRFTAILQHYFRLARLQALLTIKQACTQPASNLIVDTGMTFTDTWIKIDHYYSEWTLHYTCCWINVGSMTMPVGMPVAVSPPEETHTLSDSTVPARGRPELTPAVIAVFVIT